jgi:hypothetical protein
MRKIVGGLPDNIKFNASRADEPRRSSMK